MFEYYQLAGMRMAERMAEAENERAVSRTKRQQ